jgi:hypothetical protein
VNRLLLLAQRRSGDKFNPGEANDELSAQTNHRRFSNWWTLIAGQCFRDQWRPATTSVASRRLIPRPECDCSHLEALQTELRNALRLQEAMRNKIPELRALDHGNSLTQYKLFAENDARNGLEPPPNYDKLSKADQKALSQYDFYVEGFDLYDPTNPPQGRTSAQLCRLTPEAESKLAKVKSLAACAGIASAIQAHEDVHTQSCLRGFVTFFKRNGADRAQEEVEAYEVQIKMLREIIARIRCGYRATGQDGPVVYSGVICSLAEPFTVTGTHPMFTFSLQVRSLIANGRDDDLRNQRVGYCGSRRRSVCD